MSMASMGVTLGECAGTLAGADLRWKTPVDGLLVGAAYSNSDLSANDAFVQSVPLPVTTNSQQRRLYSRYEKGKLTLSTEWSSAPTRLALGPGVIELPSRAWYTMGSYRLTEKLTPGSYYSQIRLFPQSGNRSDPANYLKDVTASTRFEINRYFYVKMEGHYMDGNSMGFYQQTNPDGLQRVTRLMLARVGFMF